MTEVSKEEAIEKGLKLYFTGNPCKNGHVSYRRVNNNNCIDCEKVWNSNPPKNRDPTKYKKGGNKTPEYAAWIAIKRRCLNRNNQDFDNYGGRGITVHETWVESFEEFLEHVGKRPEGCSSIDRIDNNGDYAPGNVRWSNPKEQAKNRRDPVNTSYIEYKGVMVRALDISKRFNVPRGLVQKYSKKGFTFEQFLDNYKPRVKRTVKYKGVEKTIGQWAAKYGVDRNTVKNRLSTGFNLEMALTMPKRRYN